MDIDILMKIGKYIILYIPAVFGLHTWLYTKNPKYYFYFVRLFSKWRDTTWSVNCKYQLEQIDGFYQKVEDVLKEAYKSGHYKRTVNLTNKKLYECGMFNFLIQDDFGDGEFSTDGVFIKISQLNVTMNRAEEVLDELREVFNKFQKEIHFSSCSYNLDVYFKQGKNPFYGLMVQRLGKANIAHFECSFPINAIVPSTNSHGTDKKQHYLRIFKEKITINDTSFDILVKTAKKALLFK